MFRHLLPSPYVTITKAAHGGATGHNSATLSSVGNVFLRNSSINLEIIEEKANVSCSATGRLISEIIDGGAEFPAGLPCNSASGNAGRGAITCGWARSAIGALALAGDTKEAPSPLSRIALLGQILSVAACSRGSTPYTHLSNFTEATGVFAFVCLVALALWAIGR